MTTYLYASSPVDRLSIGKAFTLTGGSHHIPVRFSDASHITFGSVDDCLAMADAAQEAARRLRVHELRAQRVAAVAS